MRITSFFSKLLLIFLVLLMTYLYAQYEKKKYYSNPDDIATELLLKQLPNFDITEVGSGKTINSTEYLKGNNGLIVHVWGTWCAPCEKEMPDFLKYAESIQDKRVQFLLVAVNDEEDKIKKFMARFSIPKNVTLVIDKKNIVMDLFGMFKVPESFLFNAFGKHINKFTGPQEWLQESYKTRLDFWLNPQILIDRKVETH